MSSLIGELPYSIVLQATPWDSRVFGVDTSEIYLNIISDNYINAATQELKKITDVTRPSVFYGRVNSNCGSEKTVMLKSNFFACETQLQIYNNLNSYIAPKELGVRRMPIVDADETDYRDVCNAAENTFSYSRFHEDPFISKEIANRRMKFWCEDMYRNKVPLLVSRGRSGLIDSFVFYKIIDDKKIELVLGGSVPGKGALTPLFWASFMDHFRSLGYRHIETKISASNISIFNIYMVFGFKIKNTYIDYHKHVACDTIVSGAGYDSI